MVVMDKKFCFSFSVMDKRLSNYSCNSCFLCSCNKIYYILLYYIFVQVYFQSGCCHLWSTETLISFTIFVAFN